MNTGKEAIESLAMGIALIFFSVVVFFALRNVLYGKDMLSDYTSSFETTTYHAQDDNFREFSRKWINISAVATYALIGYNQESIEDISCEICNTTSIPFTGMETCCLKDHLMGDVSVRAEKNNKTTLYHIYIKKVN